LRSPGNGAIASPVSPAAGIRKPQAGDDGGGGQTAQYVLMQHRGRRAMPIAEIDFHLQIANGLRWPVAIH
jgi:hypothetical protein